MSKGKYYQGIFKPKRPEKYNGDPTKIIFRSSWERKFMNWCDSNPSIIEWSSEETIIPYVCPTDNKSHRYFVDFKIKIKQKSGNIKTYLVEIKPFVQTQPPKVPERKTKRFIQEVMTYGKNKAKWDAANVFCKGRGYEFIIITEKELFK